MSISGRVKFIIAEAVWHPDSTSPLADPGSWEHHNHRMAWVGRKIILFNPTVMGRETFLDQVAQSIVTP